MALVVLPPHNFAILSISAGK